MLTLAAVGGFFIPIIVGRLIPRTSFSTGWIILAIVAFASPFGAGRAQSRNRFETP